MPELPTVFGKYSLIEKLATGGMAEIYLAKLVGPGGFEKQLVIKQIHPRLSGQRHFVDLFVAEAKTLVTLAHGNIVPVYELGVIDDTYFIAMEYIDGPTLYRLTERLSQRDAQMAPPLAAWITARILDGLDYAHRKGDGVIHRDLSPRNVMLSRDGAVQIVDFGIAIARGTDDTTDEQSAPTGSFPYMSPEQVRREPLGHQSDLFSVGVLMWEMLVGKRLFARPTPDATLAAVQDEDIAVPSALRPEVPAKLDEVVMKALERDPAKRWTDAADMLAAINKYLYALDETPTSRDVTALVARYTPPETRRVPTHMEVDDDGSAGVGSAAAGQRGGINAPASPILPAGGPATAVIPRKRAQTFATHADLQTMLTPPNDEDGDLETVAHVPPPVAVQLPQRSPILLILAALGATIMALMAIRVFLRNKDQVMAPDAMPKYDAAWYAIQKPDIDAAIPIDAQIPVDAAVIIDARVSTTHVVDAAVHIDAPVAVAPRGTATLKIGADPWADIVIDGQPRGRTPAELTVPASHHVVELIYRGDDPPKTKSFAIDPTANEIVPLQAKF